jgi:hypothetical protein
VELQNKNELTIFVTSNQTPNSDDIMKPKMSQAKPTEKLYYDYDKLVSDNVNCFECDEVMGLECVIFSRVYTSKCNEQIKKYLESMKLTTSLRTR